MTVTYSLSVANTRLCGFAKLLFRWRGSIYKLLYKELLIFCALYYSLSFLYRYGLDEKNKLIFTEICNYCQLFTKFIPLSFVLGFYVTIVVTRWWDSFKCIPWPDRIMMQISSYLEGTDDRSRMMRRTIARYLVLVLTLTFQAISTSVKKRFPTIEHLQEAGLLTNAERIAYEKIPETHGRWWVPCQWISCILARARKEKRIKHDILLKQLLHEIMEYRGMCGMLWVYDWVSVPLVYTQVVTLATYMYFVAATMARQFVDTPNGANNNIDSYVPLFTILEFLCYMGWLKVAEQLINPFGEDDDDFELNYCLDRNLFISLLIADEMHNQFPILVKDAYWDDDEPILPYTKSSLNLRSKAHLGSAINIFVNEEEAEFVPLDPIMEDEKDDYILNDNISPDVGGYRFNYNMGKGDLDDVSVNTTGLRIPNSIPGSKFFNLLLGQSNENINNKNTTDRYLYYNSKKDHQNGQIIPPQSQTSQSFLQMPNFSSFKNKNKKINVTRSNTTSTNNSMSRLVKAKQRIRKSSVGTGSLGLKNIDSSAAVSRDDLTSLHSEALSFGNYKSTPIAFRKYSSSFKGRQTPAGDQQSLINFENFPDSAQSNQRNSISSSVDSSQNQPMIAAYLNNQNANSRFSVYKSQQPSPQPHQLVSQLNQKLAQLEKSNQNYQHHNYYRSASQHQADDALSTVSQISSISGLIMNPIGSVMPILERSNSRASDTKITIDEQPTQIFNINNISNNNNLLIKSPIDTLTTLKDNLIANQLTTPITTPLNIKIDDLDKPNIIDIKDQTIKESSSENLKTDELNENSTSTITNLNNLTSINEQNNETDKEEIKQIDKKLSVDNIYEPNPSSSQESLSPFQSNQSTVTSFADFLHKKVEGNQINNKNNDSD